MTVRKYICKVWSAEGRVPVGLDVAISLVTQRAAHYIFVYKNIFFFFFFLFIQIIILLQSKNVQVFCLKNQYVIL